jgi:hypothetical protein
MIDMNEEQREAHIKKINLPKPTLDQSIVHAKKMLKEVQERYTIDKYYEDKDKYKNDIMSGAIKPLSIPGHNLVP